ncbi:Tetratricopeptide repeat-containing protein [Candidatus Electronema halotolerans]
MNKFLLFFSIVVLSYSNSLNTTWQFDDAPNILNNSKLHVSELTFQQLSATLRAHPAIPNKIYRPLPCLTLGLNWYFGQDNVFGYHVVNLAIHILTGWFLFLTLHLLLRIYYKKKRYPPQFFAAAALLATLFWALAPIQTQAVTYIVQRMAAMAAMFSIIAIYAYLRGKTADQGKKYLWFVLCLVSFCAALGSKENAVLLPASLLLLELSFFYHRISKKYIIFILLIAAATFTTGFFFIRHGLDISSFHVSKLFSFLDGYDKRSFTLKERLLTEPRIVLMYFSQIVLPNVQRLSIEHDIVLSTSLFSPWTTLPAILTIFLAVSSSLFFLKKHPLFCFPVLFFFLNHTVESTIVPLELMFEHRNYLPSLFLFLPVGIVVAHILYSTPQQPVFRQITAILCTSLFLIISGHATYTRNQAWATEESLWTDAVRKAPNSSRVAHNLGMRYLQSSQYQHAYHYFNLSLKNAENSPTPETTKKISLSGMGSVSYMLGRYQQALMFFDECLDIDKKDEACLKNKVLSLLDLGYPEKALPAAHKLTVEYPTYPAYQYLAALSAYRVGDIDTSLQRLQKIVKQGLNNHEGMYLTGILLAKSGAYKNSLLFLQRAIRLSPTMIKYQIVLASVYYADGQNSMARKIIEDIFKMYPLSRIRNALGSIKKYNEIDQGDIEKIEGVLSAYSKINPL